MKVLLQFLMAVLLLNLISCGEYDEIEKEVGYKGKARLNPWLAAEKLVLKYRHPVNSTVSWKEPKGSDGVWVMPAESLSSKSFVDRTRNWVMEGGHLILIMEHAEPGSDWATYTPPLILEKPLLDMLADAGIRFEEHGKAGSTEILFRQRTYKVSANSECRVFSQENKPDVFLSKQEGSGRLTVVTDGRMFRNRWISDQDHADLLMALVETDNMYGEVGFLRGSGLSFWDLALEHLWPLLLGLAVLIVLWLWRSFVRFGPMEPAVTSSGIRGYDHHLEALGDFQWRLDKATSLLAPIRVQIVERGQRVSASAGRRDDDFFQFLADRAGIPRERVFRALAETAPADPAILTRTTADLQRLLNVLN